MDVPYAVMKSGWFWSIIAVGLALRLLLLATASQGSAFTPDSESYWRLAGNMTDRGEFSQHGRAEIFRTPGYPAFLTIGHIARRDAPLDESLSPWKLPLAVQVFADVLLVGLVYAMGLVIISRRAGLVAAALQAVSPVVVASSCRVLSDSIYSLLFTAAVLLMIGYLRTRRRWALVASAAAIAAACYVRPVGLVMAVVLAPAAMRHPRRLAGLAVFLGVLAAGIAPWVVRNWLRADYVGLSSFATDSAYYFSAAEVIARNEGTAAETVTRRLRREDAERTASLNLTPGQGARRRQQRAAEVLSGSPATFAAIHARSSLAFWLPGATDVLEVAGATTGGRSTLAVLHRDGLWAAAGNYFGGNGAAIALAIPMVLILALKYAAVIICAIARFRPRMGATAWLLTAIILVSAILPGVAAVPRFRVPVEPILNLTAAAGLLALLSRRRKTI